MATLRDAYTSNEFAGEKREALRQPPKASFGPTAERAAEAKALINFLMHDKLFLALLRSNDPRERASAIGKLNEAHYQAYGDAEME